MAWSYNPSTMTDRNKVRFLIGDTDTTDQLVQDEEVDFAITENGTNLFAAAAMLCRAIAAKFSRESDTKVESISVAASQKSERYEKMAVKYSKDASTKGSGIGSPVIGGISKSEVRSVKEDTDRVEPRFRMGMHDNPPGEIDEEDICL